MHPNNNKKQDSYWINSNNTLSSSHSLPTLPPPITTTTTQQQQQRSYYQQQQPYPTTNSNASLLRSSSNSSILSNYRPFTTSTKPSRPRLTTTLWEDESTLCYQVDSRGICVARRQDNNMINGTKLLNIAGMSRGKRDGILKNERGRIVVKVGAMHLKGVWIPFVRAKALAAQFKILDVLYPLFSDDPASFLYPSGRYGIYSHHRGLYSNYDVSSVKDISSYSHSNNSYDYYTTTATTASSSSSNTTSCASPSTTTTMSYNVDNNKIYQPNRQQQSTLNQSPITESPNQPESTTTYQNSFW